MAITLTPALEFLPDKYAAPQVIQIAGGIGPYTAVSTNTSIATVSAVTQGPNLYSNSDSLSDSTLSGLTLNPTGSPSGHASAEYVGTGSASGLNRSASKIVAVSPGQTYTFSSYLDPSHITNNAGFQVRVAIGTIDGLTSLSTKFLTSAETAPGRYSAPAWTCPNNLAPDSDFALALGTGWTSFSGTWTKAADGPGGAETVGILGTGSAQSVGIKSPIQAVVPGDTMHLSTWCNQSVITSGSGRVAIFDPTLTTQYASASVAVGADGRLVSGAWTVPGGVTQVVIIFQSTSAAWGSGVRLKFGQPMLVKGTDPGYYISSTNPQVQVFTQLLASSIVTAGQKFECSDPMLRTDGVVGPYSDVAGSFTLYPVASGSASITVTDSTP